MSTKESINKKLITLTGELWVVGEVEEDIATILISNVMVGKVHQSSFLIVILWHVLGGGHGMQEGLENEHEGIIVAVVVVMALFIHGTARQASRFTHQCK